MMNEILLDLLKWIIFNAPLFIIYFLVGKKHAKMQAELATRKASYDANNKVFLEYMKMMGEYMTNNNRNVNEIYQKLTDHNDKLKKFENEVDEIYGEMSELLAKINHIKK